MNDCGVLAETETRESRLVNCISRLDMIVGNSVLNTDNILLPDGLPGHPLALVARLLAGEVLQVLRLQQPVLLYAAGHLAGQHRDALSGGEVLE